MTRFHRTSPAQPQRRVVVTGVGGVTPLGLDMETSWQQALKGTSGIAAITKFDAAAKEGDNFKLGTRFAGEVKGFQIDQYVPKKEQKKQDLFIAYSLASAQMALANAKLTVDPSLGERMGCIIGSGMGGLPGIEEQHQRLLTRGQVSPFFIPMSIANLASGQVCIRHGLQGVNYSVTSACASGANSIGEAYNYIRYGKFDAMLAGGSESTVCSMAMHGFSSMQALSTRNEDPTKASRPFDQDRDGFVLAEGATLLVMESLEHAEKRGAPILCEVVGYGVSSDAYHITAPAPDGRGAASAVAMALRDAEFKAENVQYVNAHGTSTPMGDQLESMALEKVFGAHAKNLWVSSTKSMTGHALGAAGAIEAAFCVLALRDQAVPPTINLDRVGEGCNLDYVPHEARSGRLKAVLNNSFGFGGTNASLIFSQL